MSDPLPIRALPDFLARESLQYLDAIIEAPTRETLAAAAVRGQDYLRGLMAEGKISVNDARRVLAVQVRAVDERLRDLPVPGAPQPVGLFGGRSK